MSPDRTVKPVFLRLPTTSRPINMPASFIKSQHKYNNIFICVAAHARV